MLSLTLAIPFFNQLHDAKGPLGLLKYNTSKTTEWMIIDNGSTDPVEEFMRKYLKPKRLNYIRNQENLGLVKTYQQIYENCQTDILAILHNDVFVYEKNWDKRVISKFEEIPDLGGIGFFGAQGCGPIGERVQKVQHSGQMSGLSNMLEAEVHGLRMTEEYKPAAIFDGFAMIFRMEMLKKAGGIDQRYHYHHIYDRDIPLTSLSLGYKNIILNVPCHHWSGMTANRPEYQNWIAQKLARPVGKADKWTHDTNSHLFAAKWKDCLPLYVNDDFSFRTEPYLNHQFKGDAIQKLRHQS